MRVAEVRAWVTTASRQAGVGAGGRVLVAGQQDSRVGPGDALYLEVQLVACPTGGEIPSDLAC